PVVFQSLYPRLRAGVALAGERLLYRVVLLLAVRPGQQPEIYDGGDVQEPGHHWHCGICLWPAVALAIENLHPLATGAAQLSGTAKKGQRLDLGITESGAHSHRLRGDYAVA